MGVPLYVMPEQMTARLTKTRTIACSGKFQSLFYHVPCSVLICVGMKLPSLVQFLSTLAK
jgi:hypothetical protein